MALPDPHIAPSAYALEKAVRVAARKLGRGASAEAIEREALNLLSMEGFQPLSSPIGPSRKATPSGGTAIAPLLHVSISAAACASRRPTTQKARLYDVLRKGALELSPDTRLRTRIHVRDTSSLFLGHAPEVLDDLVETLAHVANDTSIPGMYGPFIDAALTENLALIERLPDVLSAFPAVCPIIQVGTPDNGISESVVEALAYALALVPSGQAAGGSILLTTNDCDRRAFGHRVHADAIVVHQRNAVPQEENPGVSPSFPGSWHRVMAADLPLMIPGAANGGDHGPERIHPLPAGDAGAVFRLLDDALLSAPLSGARRQLVLTY